ncbi:MAG: ATP-binding cassette domain-containing protein [Bacteroidetes bacterium]|nr:ATP-binding cassette domain-containing protein [Bacteroidota bacterium]
MKQLRRILGITADHKTRHVSYVLLNILASVFSIVSIAAIIPFLEVIFETGNSAVTAKPVGDMSVSEQLLYNLDIWLKEYISQVGKLNSLYIFSGAIIILFLAKNLFNYLSFYNIAYTRSIVVRDLRSRVYDKLVDLPISYYSEERKGDILSRMTNDAKEVEWGVVGAIELVFKHPFYILFYLGSLFFISWELTLFVMLILPISGYIISRIAKSLKGTAHRGQIKLGEVMNVIEETLGGLKVIKAFNAESQLRNLFHKKNDEHFRLMVKVNRRELAASPVSEFLGSVVISAILIFGGSMVLNESQIIDGKYFILFVIIFSQLINPAKSLSEAYFRVQKASASFDRLSEILEAENKIKDPVNPRELKTFEKAVEYRLVSFAYTDKEVVKEVSFKLKKGKTLALVGASGGGKSTIADLLPRFYDVTKGGIFIDDTDIREISVKQLRNLMGVVTQEPILFNDSILENIRLGKQESTLEQVTAAAKIANAHEFIVGFPDGYDTNIGDRGNKLSGGQRQRLAIARAVLQNPEILILDEATSALDTESEQIVQQAIENLMKGRTTLVIAHRLSTVKNADEILVIDRGEIAERGSHQSLISENGLYRKLVDLQGIGV